VAETLQTVVWQELDGRLSRPLKPTGLEALAALKTGDLTRRGKPAAIVAFRRTVPPAQALESKAERATRETAERRRETATVTRDLKAARTAEGRASAALSRAQKLVDAAERERTQLVDALERITARLQDLRTDVDERRKHLQQVAADRARLDERLVTLERES
jgi:chromosome segregation ATPase